MKDNREDIRKEISMEAQAESRRPEEKKEFEYTYSAPQQEEIRKIREKYLPKDQYVSKMEQLKQLDREAERPGTALSLSLGIIGLLLFGAGMSIVLLPTDYFVVGLVMGVIGMAVLGMAYPVYKHVTKKQREKIAEEVLKLTEELMQ